VQDHNLLVLLLAVLASLVSAFAGLFMLDRARQRTGVASLAWLFASGAVFGGGVWTTHFVAVLGYDAGLPISFHLPSTFLSAMIAMFGAACAFYLLRRASGLWRVVSSGAVLGASIAGMHHVGMRGVLLPGTFSWTPGYLVASIVLSLGFSLLCGLVYSQAPGTAWRHAAWRLGTAAVLATLAVCGMHFTAMAGLSVTPDNALIDRLGGVTRGAMASLIAGRALFLVTIGICAAGVDAMFAERRRAEETRLRLLVDQLQESERRLQESGRAKSLFLSRMSHEFRTPLNGIVGLATVLKQNASNEQADALGMIVNCGQSLGAMVDDIIDLASFEDQDFVLQPEPFAVSDLLSRIDAAHRPAAEKKGVRLSISHQAVACGRVTGDPRRISQIVSSLVSNAIKFTGDGDVSVFAKDSLSDDGRTALEFVVEDTGVGVREDASASIFEPFGQADGEITRKHGGAGLGLTLARRLCEAMGGGLTLERIPHGGSRFRAVLVLETSVPDKASGEYKRGAQAA
jgi:signal transduction histidine kinase